MDAFLSGLSTVLSSLGSNGILPIMLLILGLIFGLKFGEALRAALTGAVGMVGMNLTTDMLVAKMGPATTAMIERLGWKLDIVDTGWSLTIEIITPRSSFFFSLNMPSITSPLSLPSLPSIVTYLTLLSAVPP